MLAELMRGRVRRNREILLHQLREVLGVLELLMRGTLLVDLQDPLEDIIGPFRHMNAKCCSDLVLC